MIRMEIHAREGGADSETFAHELGTAVAKYSSSALTTEGRVVVLECL